MTLRKLSAAWLAAGIAFAAETIPPAGPLVAHEWGTFTSVAGLDGNPIPWLALGGPSALPCFVHRPDPPVGGGKAVLATVRMETPVIYFYAPRRTTLSVKVALPGGQITEWYPQASKYTGSGIEWNGVEARPGEAPEFPRGAQANHYYEARATDSVPLRAGGEQEKLIFYRGVADLAVPVLPRFTAGGKVEIRYPRKAPAPAVFLFENRGGKVGFRAIEPVLFGAVVAEEPELTSNAAAARAHLAAALVKAGLYPKEADAMLATWRDSWFEEGVRVIYLAPRVMVDTVLPLTIQPAPSATERVFVGRVEIPAPWVQREIVQAAAKGDRVTLQKYWRFLQAFWQEMKKANVPGTTTDLWSIVSFIPERCSQ
jgi:hypothetical protein